MSKVLHKHKFLVSEKWAKVSCGKGRIGSGELWVGWGLSQSVCLPEAIRGQGNPEKDLECLLEKPHQRPACKTHWYVPLHRWTLETLVEGDRLKGHGLWLHSYKMNRVSKCTETRSGGTVARGRAEEGGRWGVMGTGFILGWWDENARGYIEVVVALWMHQMLLNYSIRWLISCKFHFNKKAHWPPQPFRRQSMFFGSGEPTVKEKRKRGWWVPPLKARTWRTERSCPRSHSP